MSPQTRNGKNPLLNGLSKYKPLGGLYLENSALKDKAKTVNLLPAIRLVQSILKCQFASVDKPSLYKPLQK